VRNSYVFALPATAYQNALCMVAHAATIRITRAISKNMLGHLHAVTSGRQHLAQLHAIAENTDLRCAAGPKLISTKGKNARRHIV
jgi:hypothetical protein